MLPSVWTCPWVVSTAVRVVWILVCTGTGLTLDTTRCVEERNSSVLVKVTEDEGRPYSNSSDSGVLGGASGNLLQAFSQLTDTKRHPFSVYVPCSSSLCLTSLLRHKSPLVVDRFPPDGTTSGALCTTLYADYVAQALDELCVHLPKGKIVLFYSDTSSEYVQALDRYINGTPYGMLERWSFSGNLSEETLGEMGAALASDPGGFILMAAQHNKHVIDWARRRGVVDADHVWLVVSPESVSVWEGRLRPGERVIILDVSSSTHQSTVCFAAKPAGGVAPLSRVTFNVWILSLASERLEKVGNWTSGVGLREVRRDIWRLSKFVDKVFTIASLPWPVFHDRIETNGSVVWEGICIEILQAMAHSLNFSYNIVIPEDRKWGAAEANGDWNGMVGMVVRGEVDFAVAKFTISQTRDSVADYTVPFWHEPCVMVLPKPEENSLMVYLGPFQFELWLSIVFAIPVMGLALACMVVLREIIYEGSRILKRLSFWKHAYVTMWFTYGALMQQGCYWVPASQALRFVVGFWWFFCLVVTATYTGNLIAVLAVPKTILPVNSLQELAEQSVYKYGVVDGSAMYAMFKGSASKVYAQLWNNSIQYKKNLVLSHPEGLERVAKENYIYLGELGGVAPVVYNNCIYAIGKEVFFPSSFAFIFPENSPYLPFMDEKINALVENGMIEKWRSNFYPRDKCIAMDSARPPDAATIRDTQGAYILLGMGICAAISALILEYLWLQFSRWRPVGRKTYPSGAGRVTQEYTVKGFRLWKDVC